MQPNVTWGREGLKPAKKVSCNITISACFFCGNEIDEKYAFKILVKLTTGRQRDSRPFYLSIRKRNAIQV